MRPARRKLALAALGVVAGGALMIPGVRDRLAILRAKLGGETRITWAELAVRMAPWRAQAGIRQFLKIPPARPAPEGFSGPQWVRRLDFPLELAGNPIRKHLIFYGDTPNVRGLDCHYSVLRGHSTPHPIHEHGDEEIIVPIQGEVDIIRPAGGEGGMPGSERAGLGQMVFHPSGGPHTIRAAGPEPSGYLVFRWGGEPGGSASLRSATHSFRELMRARLPVPESRVSTVLFDGSTALLAGLHCHLSVAPPGSGSAPHIDDHDTAIVLLEGAIEIVGQVVEAPAVVFHSAGMTHSIRAVGDTPAAYLAIEFLRRRGG
jgi:mannose-6-phosphate isomerase-like protein (cupin superfamily)